MSNRQYTTQELDPNAITAERVQYWQDGVMRWFITNEQARRMVANGYAVVKSDNAVSAKA